MAIVVKPVEHLHAVMFVGRIVLTDLLQHVDFQFSCFSVFVLVFNDLQRNLTSSSVCLKSVFKK